MNLADLMELWNNAWPAGLTMLALGSVFAVILLVASEKLKVNVDPKVAEIHAALPNIDCGACGYAGCASYAKAVSQNPELIGRCSPGGQKVAEAIAAVLNLQVSESGAPKRPIIHCNAKTGDKIYRAKYQGIQTCIAANALSNVQACKFGCLGFGDCVNVCKFDALHVTDGLVVVDYEKCTGCGACAKACPRNLIEMVPFGCEQMITVACSSRENGKTTRSMCKVGCIGCGLCAKLGGEIFAVNDNLARVDYEKFAPSEKTQAAMQKCPTKVIITVGKKVVSQEPTEAAQA